MAHDFQQILQDYYPRAFPQRHGARIHDLTLLNRGWESDIYAFRVTWEEAGRTIQEDLVLRVYPGGDAYTKSSGEYRALSLLYRCGYPVPRVDCLERDASPFGLPFLIMERIPGQPLWRTMFRAQPFWRTMLRMPAERRNRLVSLFCGLLARLHAIDWRPLLENPQQYEPDGEHAIVGRILNTWEQVVNQQTGLLPGFAPALAWLGEHSQSVVSTCAAIVHLDFHPENVILRPDDTAVVIDWTNFDISDYRFDLAWTLVVVCSVEGLHWREPLLREYERWRGAPVEGLEFFEAAACVRRLYSVVFSLKAGAAQLGMRPGAEEDMRRQAPALRRVRDLLRERTGLMIPEVEEFLNG